MIISVLYILTGGQYFPSFPGLCVSLHLFFHAPSLALVNLQPQALFAFLEDFIYKGKFDGQIRNGLRRNQSVAEALQHDDIKDLWEKALGGGCSDDGNKSDVAMEERNLVYFHHCQIFDLPFLNTKR